MTTLSATVGLVPSSVQVAAEVPSVTLAAPVAAAPLPLRVKRFIVSAAGTLVVILLLPLIRAVVLSAKNVSVSVVVPGAVSTALPLQLAAVVQVWVAAVFWVQVKSAACAACAASRAARAPAKLRAAIKRMV